MHVLRSVAHGLPSTCFSRACMRSADNNAWKRRDNTSSTLLQRLLDSVELCLQILEAGRNRHRLLLSLEEPQCLDQSHIARHQLRLEKASSIMRSCQGQATSTAVSGSLAGVVGSYQCLGVSCWRECATAHICLHLLLPGFTVIERLHLCWRDQLRHAVRLQLSHVLLSAPTHSNSTRGNCRHISCRGN
jgi:hypothetical protein